LAFIAKGIVLTLSPSRAFTHHYQLVLRQYVWHCEEWAPGRAWAEHKLQRHAVH
jgi:hypothetical protein